MATNLEEEVRLLREENALLRERETLQGDGLEGFRQLSRAIEERRLGWFMTTHNQPMWMLYAGFAVVILFMIVMGVIISQPI